MDGLTFQEALECELIPEDAIKFENPDFDSAIIGISDEGKLIYDH